MKEYLKIIMTTCFSAIFIVSCVPADKEPLTNVNIDVNDVTWQKIYDYKDSGQLDSLLLYTSHPDPSYRYIVANGLASLRDIKSADSLEVLLQDPVMKVRVAAAYAMGQLKEEQIAPRLLRAFRSKDTLNVDNAFNGAILEGIGKTGGETLLKNIATVSTYRVTDTLLLLGQARSIYRFALRGITVPEGTDKMVQYVTDEKFPNSVRTVAAHYLYRAKDLKLDDFKYRLGEVFASDPDPNIRMALAVALSRTSDLEILNTLKSQLEVETDYRVKCNIIRGLSSFPYVNVIEPVLQSLTDENPHIANTAADFLINSGEKNDAIIYRNYLSDSIPYSVDAKIYSAVLKHIPVFYTNTKSIIKNDIRAKIDASEDIYEQSAYLQALAQDPYNYRDIALILKDTKVPLMKSTGMEALGTILKSDNFIAAHRGRFRTVKRAILDIIKSEIEQGDAGAIAVAGTILVDDKAGLIEVIDSTNFIEVAMDRLNLPQEIESYNALKSALDKINGVPHTPKVPAHSHQIDYDLFAAYGDSVQAAIKTDKGIIRVDLLTELAPGTVANFMQLSDKDFYDGKTFHRVVPNFVVQAGCPRGDGYGSLDYAIRSEVSQAYYDDEGYVGMASAGPDTEGTQWFITHSPTMHLDGNYTIFGKVVEGMEIVHDITVGDKILDVIITKK